MQKALRACTSLFGDIFDKPFRLASFAQGWEVVYPPRFDQTYADQALVGCIPFWPKSWESPSKIDHDFWDFIINPT